jgi:phage baseplate assembly protein W
MASYIGFSTKNVNKVRNFVGTGTDGGSGLLAKSPQFQIGKKFKLTDEQLVITDFINALNIPQGQKPGKPSYGTTLWSFIFEPNTVDVRQALSNEVKRVAQLDPRINLNSLEVYDQESGILIELEIAVVPFNNALTFSIFFDPTTNSAFGS